MGIVDPGVLLRKSFTQMIKTYQFVNIRSKIWNIPMFGETYTITHLPQQISRKFHTESVLPASGSQGNRMGFPSLKVSCDQNSVG